MFFYNIYISIVSIAQQPTFRKRIQFDVNTFYIFSRVFSWLSILKQQAVHQKFVMISPKGSWKS